MVTVAVAWEDTPLGACVVRGLGSTADIGRVVGLRSPTAADGRARREPPLPARAGGASGPLAAVDVLVRLPAAHDTDSRLATRRLVDAALAAEVPRIVHVSTAAVYGAHDDNELPLDETAPLRPHEGLPCAVGERELEDDVRSRTRGTSVALTVLRPSIVVGATLEDPVLTRFVEAPRFPAVTHHRPPLQFLHVDDLVGAIVHVIRSGVTGTYNVSAEGWLSFQEVTAILGRRIVDIGEEVALSLTDRAWALGVGPAPAGVVHHLMYPWVVSADALIGTGWRPVSSNRDAVADLARAHRDRLAVGPVRVRRSRLRRAVVALASMSVTAIGLLGWRRRRAS